MNEETPVVPRIHKNDEMFCLSMLNEILARRRTCNRYNTIISMSPKLYWVARDYIVSYIGSMNDSAPIGEYVIRLMTSDEPLSWLGVAINDDASEGEIMLKNLSDGRIIVIMDGVIP